MGNDADRWMSVDSDPNILLLREQRKEALSRACTNKVVDRVAFIKDLCANRRVLDIGCVTHDARFEGLDAWLHQHVVKASGYCLGIDILEKDIARLKEKGYNVRVHDLTSGPLEEKFDLAICGEVIEHIEAIGTFLENLRDSVKPGGYLVFTTPYPWFLGYTLRNSLRNHFLPGSVDHVVWYDPSDMCELAIRHAMKLEQYYGVLPGREPGGLGRSLFEGFLDLTRKGLIPGLHPYAGCRSLLYMLKVAEKPAT